MKKYLVLFLLFTSCVVSQNLRESHRLSPGMSKDEVEQIMGLPTKSEFDRGVEEWHYCRTGLLSDEYIALFFHEGKLIRTVNYTVEGKSGSCSKFIKMGNYREPDIVVEIRGR